MKLTGIEILRNKNLCKKILLKETGGIFVDKNVDKKQKKYLKLKKISFLQMLQQFFRI